MSPTETDTAEETTSRTEDDLDEPSMYRVYLHNDDYTTMAFVEEILMTVFNKPVEEASRIMLKVHNEGIGLCGVFTYEVAETKVLTVHRLAKMEGFPLRCSMEKE